MPRIFFKIKNNIEKPDELIIREYYKDTSIRNVFIFGLRINPELDEAIAYFSSRLMHSLNSYGLKNNKYFQEDKKRLFLT